MGHEWVGDLAAIAADQDGVFTAAQAESIGVTRRRLARAVIAGVLDRRHPSVYGFTAAPSSDRASIRAATMQVPGSVASHESALRLHGIVGVPPDCVVTADNLAHHRFAGIRVHRVRDLIPPHRALITGIARVGDQLDRRRPDEPAPRSKLERRVDRLLEHAPLSRPSAEYPLPTDRSYAGFVDRCWGEAMLILEIDGRTWHSREQDMAKDRARDREAARLGWQTFRVLDDELDDCADEVVDDVVCAFTTRILQLTRSA